MILKILAPAAVMCWMLAAVSTLLAQDAVKDAPTPAPAEAPAADKIPATDEVPASEVAKPSRDPATPSPKMRAKLARIRQAENFDALVEERDRLRAEVERLQEELAQLRAAATKKVEQRQTELTIQLPQIHVASRFISADRAVATLAVGDAKVVVRENTEIMIPLSKTNSTVARVIKIDHHKIELEFPELDHRQITVSN